MVFALTAGAVTAAIVGLVYSSAETRETAEALCVQVAQHQNPGSVIEVLSTERLGHSQYAVSGTMTDEGKSPAEFDCMAYADGHDGWGAAVSGGETPK